jgi:hypothetical protein
MRERDFLNVAASAAGASDQGPRSGSSSTCRSGFIAG